MNTKSIYVCGDVHGQLEKLVNLLQSNQLIDDQRRWCGADATLCFVGDFADRGPDVIGVFDLVMQLEREAETAGGKVISLIGNHEVLMLSAYLLGEEPCEGPAENFLQDWLRFGLLEDLDLMTDAHVEWIQSLPAMALLDDVLIIHADAMFYLNYGSSIGQVNSAIQQLLSNPDAKSWDHLFGEFTGRMMFFDPLQGQQNLDHFLKTFGASKLIHGHTPIPIITQQPPEAIEAAHVYQQGRCINVDGAMYMGGSGFLYQII